MSENEGSAGAGIAAAIAPHLPKTARERGRVAPAKLAHVVRRTARFAEMVEWYQIVLEAEVVYRADALAFMTYDEEHHRVAIIHIPELPDRNEMAAGTDHVAFTYDDLDALLKTYRRLAASGIRPFWSIHHGATLSSYYKDPDGNSLELQIDCFRDAAAVNDWLGSGAFASNPVGVIVDFDDLCARHEAGEPEARLLEQPPLPEGTTPFDMLRF